MLKKRIIGKVLVKNDIAVQSISFNKYLPIGKPEIVIEYLSKWGIDEIIYLDIDATFKKKEPDYMKVSQISKKSFVPITVGGGIKSVDQINKLLRAGADKISLNSSAIENQNLIEEAAKIYGNQCIVASIDVKKVDNKYKVFKESGKINTGINPLDLSIEFEQMGAGEILLSSIDRDGSKKGYDLELIELVSNRVSIPVIASSGANKPSHFLDGLIQGGASAVSAGNYFNYTEHSPMIVKSFIDRKNHNMRVNSYLSYKIFDFDKDERITKKNDEYLRSIRFENVRDEVI